LGRARGWRLSTPRDGCSRFGPDPPPGGLRPADADPTGGYYQPLRVDLPGAATAFGLSRILCDLPNASRSVATTFANRYVPNANPQLLPVSATRGGLPVSLAALPAGSRVVLQASWPAGSAETYARYDGVSDTVTTKREAMSIAWYASAGTLDTESTGRAEDDPTLSTDNGYATPITAGPAHVWVVLRDSRGGVDFADVPVDVTP
jgi:hypothetical protein